MGGVQAASGGGELRQRRERVLPEVRFRRKWDPEVLSDAGGRARNRRTNWDRGVPGPEIGVRLDIWHGGKAGSQEEVKPDPVWR